MVSSDKHTSAFQYLYRFRSVFTQVLNPVTVEVKGRKLFSSLDNPGESELALDEHLTFPNLDLKRMNPKNPTQINRLLDMVNGVKCCGENVQTFLGLSKRVRSLETS